MLASQQALRVGGSMASTVEKLTRIPVCEFYGSPYQLWQHLASTPQNVLKDQTGNLAALPNSRTCIMQTCIA